MYDVTPVSMCIAGFCGGGTQWVVLSATVNKRRSAARHGGTGSGVDGSDGAMDRIVRTSTKCLAFEPTTHTTSQLEKPY